MSCRGKANKGGMMTTCYGQVFKCERCGTIGCSKDGCPNQKFSSNNGRCTVCGGNIKIAVNY